MNDWVFHEILIQNLKYYYNNIYIKIQQTVLHVKTNLVQICFAVFPLLTEL